MTSSAVISTQRLPSVGVIGGMGPLATVDFLHKLVAATPARCDQEHLPLWVRFSPDVPDRAQALAGCGPSPEPGLVQAARELEALGVGCLAIPCNTAHAWWPSISTAVVIPVLHIADAALRAASVHGEGGSIGLLATTGTLESRIYQSRTGAGSRWILPTAGEQSDWVMQGVRDVKAGRLAQARVLLEQAARTLADRGATVVIMGCTEVPVALTGVDIGVPVVDSNLALAHACIAWVRSTMHEDTRPVLQAER